MKSQAEQWLLQERYGGEKSAGFFTDCKALALGEPLAYLIGHAPFLDCTIHLDGRPLIPRPETEFWVEKAIMQIKKIEQPAVLDLCAGSGCVGVAVAKNVPQAGVDFAEIDARLLPTIQRNIDVNINTPERCRIYHSNLLAGLPADTLYHFILSNPPYIDPALHRVDDSVRDFEPHLALFGGQAGMELIEQIITIAPAHLHPAGQLWIEHEPEQCNAIATLAHQHGFTCIHQADQYSVQRYSVLMLQ